MSQNTTILTTLQYSQLPKDGSKPWVCFNADATIGERPKIFKEDPCDVEIENVRGHENAYDMDTAGFKFIKHTSAHMKFTDNEEIKREYYPESVDLLKKVTGANRVIVFDHTIRRHRPGVRDSDTSEDNRQPISSVHVDQTPESAARRVHMHAPPEIAPELLKHRFQVINLWRPINHIALDCPLAICDFRSISWEKDLFPITLKYPHREGETFRAKYNPAHKWKYLRGMTLDEAVLIKCFDSKMDGSVATLAPHTAFVDPTTPKDAPLRESIELRALVFFDS